MMAQAVRSTDVVSAPPLYPTIVLQIPGAWQRAYEIGSDPNMSAGEKTVRGIALASTTVLNMATRWRHLHLDHG